MPVDHARMRQHLKAFNLKELFVEELGWDRHGPRPLEVRVDGSNYTLHALAEKRGMVAYLCDTGPALPNDSTLRKVERQVAGTVHEHIIIYTDGARTTQVWQWVKREPGRPDACRQHTFHRSQPGDALIQKLQGIGFDMAEEEELT